MLTTTNWVLDPASPQAGDPGRLTIRDAEDGAIRSSVCIIPGSPGQHAPGGPFVQLLDEDTTVTHIEIRCPDSKGSVCGGVKSLFRLPGSQRMTRLAVTEAPIDALSLAALEDIRVETLYVATGGGMGPGTESRQSAGRSLQSQVSPAMS